MLEIITAYLVAICSPQAAEGLRSTAPIYLTSSTAKEHIAAAFVASAATQTDPSLLLSIAWHESRYVVTAITREPPDPITGEPRWSCGPMTPEPLKSLTRCKQATSSTLAGYLAGARHLRVWINACRGNRACALRHYGGKAAPVFVERAAKIRRAMARPRIVIAS